MLIYLDVSLVTSVEDHQGIAAFFAEEKNVVA